MAEEIKNLNQRLHFLILFVVPTLIPLLFRLGPSNNMGPFAFFNRYHNCANMYLKLSQKNPTPLLLPSIYYGVSFEHEPFFNVSISYNILLNFISDICISLFKQGINRLYVINGHHGNIGLLQYVGQHISTKYSIKEKFFYYINYWQMLDKNFDHAGEVETSLMLVICPQLVRMDLLKRD